MEGEYKIYVGDSVPLSLTVTPRVLEVSTAAVDPVPLMSCIILMLPILVLQRVIS